MLRDNLNILSYSIAGYLTDAVGGTTTNSYRDMAANGMDIPSVAKEAFGDMVSVGGRRGNGTLALGSFIALVLWLIILLMVGEYLFNNILVKIIPAIRPITSIWQLLGLSILFNILF